MTIEYLNDWFEKLSHREKAIVEGGYWKGCKLSKSEFQEIDENDNILLGGWNRENEYERLEHYCHYLDIDINTINIDDKQRFIFLPYDEKVKYLNLDNRLKWGNDSLNMRYNKEM